MNSNIKALYDLLKKRDYRKTRRDIKKPEFTENTAFAQTEYMKALLDNEVPVIYDGDIFGFNRSTNYVVAENWGNLIPNYGRLINCGFEKTKQKIKEKLCEDLTAEQIEFANAMIAQLDDVSHFASRYKAAAENKCPKLAAALNIIPKRGAKSFYEACVFLKLLCFVLRLSGMWHVTFGRFDQYMYPFFKSDIEKGVSEEELFETLEAFFISVNMDSDLFPGIQQGDNGQSMVLGGYDSDGNDMYNPLSKMCMEASLDLSIIDPKINLRVNKNTPHERFVYATTLTKKGLGFPQYCNDDVVVPGLIKLGYSKEDAVNYGVAACWEYLVPDNGADIANRTTMDFPRVVGESIRENLEKSETFERLTDFVKASIEKECNRITEMDLPDLCTYNVFGSILIDGCIEKLKNLHYGGAKYINFGCHGAGISTAADSLAAVKKLVFEDKSVSKKDILSAVDNDFAGYEKIRNMMLACPKMGQNDDFADDIAFQIMECFSSCLNGKPNKVGGVWRAGTGSAQEYIFKGEQCPATCDGRNAFAEYASSFSPSLTSNARGLLSVIASFTKFDMTKIINGGPLTIEIHDTVLKNDMGIDKVAMIVEQFIKRGGHQLQINSINRDVLLDAQKHPENYPNLVVRVWGWSGYFNELDVRFQNHIIRRTEFMV